MRFLAGLVVGVAVVAGAAFLFLTQGGMPVAAHGARPLPLERFLANRALDRATARSAETPSPVPADEPTLLAGAKIYRENCQLCHGTPGETSRSPVALGMFPPPPRLMPPGEGVTDDPVGETYWKVKNGIRLTGMPGFEGALTDTSMWQVSQLLRHAGDLPEPVLAAMR